MGGAVTKWEYRRISCHWQSAGRLTGWVVSYEKEPEPWLLERAVNREGAQGWELVGPLTYIIKGTSYTCDMLFKRPIES